MNGRCHHAHALTKIKHIVNKAFIYLKYVQLVVKVVCVSLVLVQREQLGYLEQVFELAARQHLHTMF